MMENEKNSKNIKILWTGGWDSTYRVLDLVINKKMTVQPYYIVDKRRSSTYMEFKTMDLITKMMSEIDSKASTRILNRIVVDKDNIRQNSIITNAYKRLKQISHLGSQYDWLARYSHEYDINDLELCIHIDDTVEGFIKNDVELIQVENDKYYKLKDHPSNSDLKIFSYYHFPLFDMSKLQMEKIARESGFLHIMEKTWFCHRPIRNKPCGMCNPCNYTREEGLGRRVPKPTLLMKVNRKVSNKWKRIRKKIKN